MPTLINGKVTYQGGEALPAVGSTAYNQVSQGIIPSAISNAPITSANLAPTKDVKITPTINTGLATNLGANLATQATTNANEYAKTDSVTQALNAKNQSTQDYINKLIGQQGATEATTNAYAQNGVDEAQNAVKDINNQIIAEQTASRHQIEQIQKNNPSGGFSGALNDEINRVNRESVSKQADLAVIQMSLQGKYDSAKTIADRAVAVKLEQQQNELAAYKLQYEENKDLFTKAEQRQYEENIKAKDRAYTSEQNNLQAVSDFSIKALEKGVPTPIVAKMQKAKTISEAISIGGDYLSQIQSDLTYKELPDGRAVMLDKQGNIVKEVAKAPQTKEQKDALIAQAEAIKTVPALVDKVNMINGLITATDNSGAVGTNALGRISLTTGLTGARQDFVAGVKQLISKETLDTLINLKKAGGTLGALSDQERVMLQNAASKIGNWEIPNKDGSGSGFYNASEKSFKAELETLKTLTQRAINEARGVTKDNPLGLDVSSSDSLNLGI